MTTFDYSSIEHLQVLKDRQSNSFSPIVTLQRERADASSSFLINAVGTKVEIWQLSTSERLQTLEGMTQPTQGLLLSPDEKLLFCRGVTEVYVWDLASSQMLHATGKCLDRYQGGFISMAYDEEREKLYFGCSRGSRKCWNLKAQRWELGGFDCGIVTISRGKRVLVGSYINHLKVWRLRDMQSVYRGDVMPGVSQSEFTDLCISSLAVSDDGWRAYCGYHSGEVELWRTNRFESLGLLARPAEEATDVDKNDPFMDPSLRASSLVLSPDEKTLAVGYGNGLIRLWDLETKTEILTLWEHTNVVKGLVFAQEGELLVSSALDGTIRLWGNPSTLD